MVFRLDFGQISFNLAENAFATQQLTFLATSNALSHIATRACAEINFDFWNFFSLSLFLLFFLFAAVIELLLGLLAVKKLL